MVRTAAEVMMSSRKKMNPEITANQWSLVIEPNRKWFDIDFWEIYHYRDLVGLLIRRDFVTLYKQTILGPLWFILNPLFTTIIYTFIFNGLAKIPTDGIPQVLFYYSGTMAWGYFSSCLNNSADTFSANAGLFGKVYFPRLTVPISKTVTNLIAAGLQFATLGGFYLYYILSGSPTRPSIYLVLLPVLFLQLALLGTGIGIVVSALTTKYKDLRQLVTFGISLWMYATPIVYPLSQVPSRYLWIMLINPLTAPIELLRQGLFNVGSPSITMVFVSIISTICFVLLGLALFSRNERTFVDVI
jgi:lipopolysaccharide transport system permease protein